MTIITLPPEVEEPLAEEARRKGTTPELLAMDCLRKVFTPDPRHATLTEGETLFDFLEGYAGTISGTTEPLSEDCGRRFAEGKSELGVEIGVKE
jgi:hypothetical protein